MKLVANWAQSWKWISMQASFAVVTLSTTWVTLPATVHTPTLDSAETWAAAILGAIAMFGRLVQQQPPGLPTAPVQPVPPAQTPTQ